MNSNTKKLIILVGIILVLSGIGSCLMSHTFFYAFDRLKGINGFDKTWQIKGNFDDISVTTNTANVTFAISRDGKAQAAYRGNNQKYLSVKTSGGKLTITERNRLPWFLRFGVNIGKTEVTVFLPKQSYDELKIRTDTGAVVLPSGFRFENAKIETDTGSVIADSISVKDDLEVKTDTGSVHLTDIKCEDLSVKTDTGSIHMKNVITSEKMEIKSDTGSVEFERCDAEKINIKTDTGRVKGSFRSEKIFSAKSDTGSISVPDTVFGGQCVIETDTGSIEIVIER